MYGTIMLAGYPFDMVALSLAALVVVAGGCLWATFLECDIEEGVEPELAQERYAQYHPYAMGMMYGGGIVAMSAFVPTAIIVLPLLIRARGLTKKIGIMEAQWLAQK